MIPMPPPVGKWTPVRAGDHRWFHDTDSMSELKFPTSGEVEVYAQGSSMRMAKTVFTGSELIWIIAHAGWLTLQDDANVVPG